MGESLLNPERRSLSRTGSTPVDTAALFADAGLERRGASLVLGDVRLSEIAEKVGTPTYAYNAAVIRRQYKMLDQALAKLPHRVCFAV
ncbi:MAG TPA: hypothetical protein VH438_15445, partial [Gemmatimonadales bacterium]